MFRYCFPGLVFAATAISCCVWYRQWLVGGLVLCAAVAFFVGLLMQKRAAARAQSALQEQLSAQAARSEELAEAVEEERRQSLQKMEHFHNKVAHSLRIPVSVIQGYADILAGDLVPDPSARCEYLSKISERSSYITQILSEIIHEDSDGENPSGQVRLPFDLLRLLRDIVDDMALSAAQHDVDLRFITAEQGVPMLGDEGNLRRAFYNILENALKYMGRPGAVNITVTTMPGAVSLMFKDDGVGMDEHDAVRVFEQGFRGTNAGKGAGTGLFLASNIVLAHGGTITARSGWGLGMGIHITLPLDGTRMP